MPDLVKIPDCQIVTYHSYNDWGDVPGYYKGKCFTTTIDLRQDLDILWGNINRQHKRHIIRSGKNGTKVTISKKYEEFYLLYKKLFEDKQYTDRFGLKILTPDFMRKYVTLFLAENNGEIIGGNFYFLDEEHALLGQSVYKHIENTVKSKKLTTDASCCLFWEAMKYFKELGIATFDLGDVASNDKEIHRQMTGSEYFKRSFGGVVISRYSYMKFNSRYFQSIFQTWKNFHNLGGVFTSSVSVTTPE